MGKTKLKGKCHKAVELPEKPQPLQPALAWIQLLGK